MVTLGPLCLPRGFSLLLCMGWWDPLWCNCRVGTLNTKPNQFKSSVTHTSCIRRDQLKKNCKFAPFRNKNKSFCRDVFVWYCKVLSVQWSFRIIALKICKILQIKWHNKFKWNTNTIKITFWISAKWLDKHSTLKKQS